MNINRLLISFQTDSLTAAFRGSCLWLRGIALSVSAISLLSACSGDHNQEPVAVEDNVVVSFTLAIDKPTATTRADDDDQTWGNETGEANEFETAIDFQRFHVFLYEMKANKTLNEIPVAQVTPLLFMGPENTEERAIYQFTGKLDLEAAGLDKEELKTGDYRIMVYANCDLDNNNDGNLSSTQFSAKGTDKNFKSIPMWGVSKVDFSNVKEGEAVRIGDVALLRAMAKIHVGLSDNLKKSTEKSVRFTSITFKRHNASGYVVPANYAVVDATTALKYRETINELKNSADGEYVISVAEDSEEDDMVNGGSFTFYLPEIKNSNDDEVIMQVAYTVDGESKTGDIHFCRYVNGNPIKAEGTATPDLTSTQNSLWHIVRNHIYDFTITGVPDNTVGLTVNVAVKDWSRKYYEIDY